MPNATLHDAIEVQHRDEVVAAQKDLGDRKSFSRYRTNLVFRNTNDLLNRVDEQARNSAVFRVHDDDSGLARGGRALEIEPQTEIDDLHDRAPQRDHSADLVGHVRQRGRGSSRETRRDRPERPR